MKKTTKIILLAAIVLALAGAALAAVRLYAHEKEQNEALRELAEQMIALQEEKQAAESGGQSEERISGLESRITRLEVQADYAEADYRWFAIGNSITVHAPNEVWWSETGMAASETSKDYVHLTAEALAGTKGKVSVHPLYFYEWETAEGNRGEKLDMLDPYLDPRLQLVTIQLGENAEDLTTFEQDLEALIRCVQTKAPEARILVIGDFWTSGEREQMKREAAEKTGAEFVSLEEIRDNPEYQAGIGAVVYDPEGNPHTVENKDVAGHPGDRGMQYIADRLTEILTKEP